MIQVDTKNILFIVGGAFDGIEEIVTTSGEKVTVSVRITKPSMNQLLHARNCAEDIQKFGIIPELIGRLPVSLRLFEQLTVDDLVRILKSHAMPW